jgi:ATP-dependent Lon protease
MTSKDGIRDPLDVRSEELLPLLPLRDVVLFPGSIVPLLVGRERSVAALKAAADGSKMLLVAAQRDPSTAEPSAEDLYEIGTVARIHQSVRLPDGTIKVLLEGIARGQLISLHEGAGFAEAELHAVEPAGAIGEKNAKIRKQSETLGRLFTEYVLHNRRLPDEAAVAVQHLKDVVRRVDTICAYTLLRVAQKQRLLAELDLASRQTELMALLRREIELLRVEESIEDEVKEQIAAHEKEDHVSERMRAIREELSLDGEDELEDFIRQIDERGLSEEASEAAHKEVARLARMAPMSPESTVSRHYLEVLLGLPWDQRSRDRLDTKRVEKRLDADHFGLEKVKERILEYLAVIKLSGNIQGQILCLVGPPGVGKTSLGRSIADAMGRKFVRVSLGGVRDEAEIRGHRRTYIGSRPGRVLEGIRKAGVKNPVFLFDEIDKLGSDFRGDPSSALLEVLDPEQNSTYTDHFLELPFDLSEVFFIATANVLHEIPPALEDRMEIIRLPGYLAHEKVAIAKDFLLPRMRQRHGLSRVRFSVTEPALADIVNLYTREAGVRGLERHLASICRKIARRRAERLKLPRSIQRTNLHRFLGPPQYLHRMVEEEPEIGVVTGLAWTPVGGEILEIEVMMLPGTGKLELTGNLKDVMKESARAAYSYAKRAVPDGPHDLQKLDIHIHVPEGAVPKDGPSAGVAMATALVSVLTGRKVRRDVAMTGELTLRGKVLPIGGLPEKAVAAERAGCRHLVLPADNEKDYRELPRDIRRGLQWHLVQRVEEAIELALLPAEDEAGRIPRKATAKRPAELAPKGLELPPDGIAH